jgi:ribosomal protein S18 acetylase RimI-like enzyme
MKITYRDATPADAAVIDRIFDTSFCDTFAHLYAAEDLDVFLAGFNVADWRRELEDPAYEFRIGEVNGEPVGYVKLGPMKLPIETNRPALVLDQLYILKEHHGVGIAHALMDWTVDRAKRRGAEELFLTVYVDNHRARRFYDRYGFEAVGRYDFMVGSHADEDIIMRKVL